MEGVGNILVKVRNELVAENFDVIRKYQAVLKQKINEVNTVSIDEVNLHLASENLSRSIQMEIYIPSWFKEKNKGIHYTALK